MEFGVPIPDGPAAVGRFGSGGGSAPGGPLLARGGVRRCRRAASERFGGWGGLFVACYAVLVVVFLPFHGGGGDRVDPPPSIQGLRGGGGAPADVEQGQVRLTR